MVIYNSSGSQVSSTGYSSINNGEGLTVDNIVARETYTVQIRQNSGLSAYKLSIGCQKETVNITSYTEISDSVQFKDQFNNYIWTAPPIGGRYRFEVTNLSSGNLHMVVFNSSDSQVSSTGYSSIGNGEGLSIDNMTAGETYTIQMRQNSGLSVYNLKISKQ